MLLESANVVATLWLGAELRALKGSGLLFSGLLWPKLYIQAPANQIRAKYNNNPRSWMVVRTAESTVNPANAKHYYRHYFLSIF